MNGFPSVTLEFDGKQYEVASDRVWGLINSIEQHVTFTGLAKRMSAGDVPRIAVCTAFASALSYASGKPFNPQEVSAKLGLENMVAQAAGLLQILSIPESPPEMAQEPGKPVAAKKSRTKA
jgi:hypothetical protein